jgi:putative phage-type endonuclease
MSIAHHPYIEMFHLLNDYDNLVSLCKERLFQMIDLHIADYKNENVDEKIIKHTHAEILNDLSPLINEFISILANKDVADINSFDHLEHYSRFSNSILECVIHMLNDAYNNGERIPRQRTVEYNKSKDTKTIKETLHYLQTIPQPEQRTEEWYAFRHNCITASSIWKVLDTQKQRESYIKSKLTDNSKNQSVFKTNIESAFHHGHKYEPLSVMLYERINKTKIGEFGCIKHKKYDFIAASPDGINIDPSSEKYGTLLEIKNVVSRNITSIPKKEYWVQMQLQMEVCDLDYCDFLETKFVQYESEDAFLNDCCESNKPKNKKPTLLKNKEDKYIGLIIMFFEHEKPIYEYCPLELNTPSKILKWKENIINTYLHERPSSSWVDNIFWKCETYSCIYVERNRAWFNDALPEFKKTWDIINTARLNDTPPEASNASSTIKKIRKTKKAADIFSGNAGVCLIKL